MATVIAETQSLFQKIQVLEHEIFGKQLILDGLVKLSESDAVYSHSLASPLLDAECTKNIVILGAGHGSIAQQILSNTVHESSIENIYQVEIDIDVTRLSQHHLAPLHKGALSHPKVNIITGDALSMIENTRRMNGIVVDISWLRFRETQDHTTFFPRVFKALRKSLMPGGIISIQCGPTFPSPEYRHAPDLQALAETHFENIIIHDIDIPSFQSRWRFLSAKKPL